MEKLFNWTIGSFFRTIGRLIAYFAIGAFIAYILSNSNIKLPRITNLFLDHVSAATLTTEVEDIAHPYITLSNESDMQTVNWDSYSRTIYSTTSYSIQNYDFIFSTNISGADYIEIPFSLSQPYTIESTNTNYEVYCHEFTCTHWDTSDGLDTCDEWSCTDTRRSGFTNYEQYDSEIKNMNFTISMSFTNNTWSYCEINNNMIICPSNQRVPNKLTIQSNFRTTKTTSVNFVMNRAFNLYRKTNIQGAIESQTQQQQQQHNETISTITDSNTTSETNSTATFFNNQTDDTPSGLTTAVTAPLQILQNLVNGSTSPLCFTLNSKVSCIPDGSIIWGNGLSTSAQHWFSSGLANPKQSFITFFNLVVGGFLCYKMLLSMLRIWQNLLDPTRSTIEVMKL